MNEREAATALFSIVVGEVDGDYEEVILETTMLEGMADTGAKVVIGATEEPVEVPSSTIPILVQLRRDMATLQGGTWFAARFSWTPAGDFRATFDYDSRPRWAFPVDPESEREMLIEDFETFPRTPEATPQWLTEIIDASR